MKIKEVEKQDNKKALQIYNECFHLNKKNDNFQPTKNLIGLYQEQELIGICQIDFINNLLENEKIAYLNSFCVTPKEQNKGYGDYFLKEIIQYCKEQKATKINLTSNLKRKYAHQLYQKNNFTIIDTVFLNKNI